MMKLNPKGGIPWIRWVIYVKLASSGKILMAPIHGVFLALNGSVRQTLSGAR